MLVPAGQAREWLESAGLDMHLRVLVLIGVGSFRISRGGKHNWPATPQQWLPKH